MAERLGIPLHEETVPMSLSMQALIFLPLVVGVTIFFAADLGVSARPAPAAARWIVLAVVVLVVAVLMAFRSLRITLTETTLLWSFGPLRWSADLRSIRSAENERYEWVAYGGWGWRCGRGRRRAYTVPFLRTGVLLTVDDGEPQPRRIYLSSRDPERLANEIRRLLPRAPAG